MLKDTRHRSASSTEKCFSEALTLAKQQGSLFWELRSAVSLARLWTGQDRKSDASQILAPVCDEFAKGLQIADVREARALLCQLAGDKG
jgi:predicted ATPase